jgi:vacuolar-type H+-ATPase subunit F/Vma7
MSGVVVLGEEQRTQGFALAAAEVAVAEGPEQVRDAWERLPDDVAVLLLTPMAWSALRDQLDQRPRLLWTVLPG